MEADFLGRGWGLPLVVGNDGRITMAEYNDDIQKAMVIILKTAKGERVMRPDFGCGIHTFVFQVINTTTLSLIEHYVKEALLQWEPRIDVIAVKTSTENLDDGQISIDITYRVRGTNNVYNLVYPFYIHEDK